MNIISELKHNKDIYSICPVCGSKMRVREIKINNKFKKLYDEKEKIKEDIIKNIVVFLNIETKKKMNKLKKTKKIPKEKKELDAFLKLKREKIYLKEKKELIKYIRLMKKKIFTKNKRNIIENKYSKIINLFIYNNYSEKDINNIIRILLSPKKISPILIENKLYWWCDNCRFMESVKVKIGKKRACKIYKDEIKIINNQTYKITYIFDEDINDFKIYKKILIK